MRSLKRLLTMALTFICASCAMMGNDMKSSVSINSNPSGASVIIDGRNYGMTPMSLQMKVRNYDVSLIKEGYGIAKFKLETIQGIEEGSDGGRCLADAIGSMFVITFYSAYYSDYCKTFKKQEYDIEIPYTASRYSRKSDVRQKSPGAVVPSPSAVNSTGEVYGNEFMTKQGYGRSRRLPLF